MIQMKQPEDVAHSFQGAWNAHDMAALATLFHEDATFVNRFGHYVRGVEEIVALHAPIHETIYRDSTLKNELIDVVPNDAWRIKALENVTLTDPRTGKTVLRDQR
jgi:uncharacterized protein (TIGR02246 family)